MLLSKKNNYGVPQAFGQSILYVATDSMENPNDKNSIDPGTGIIINKTKPENIAVGDVVTFYWDKINAPDTHRVVEVNYVVEEGKYYFTTMGDNPIAHEKDIKETWSQDVLIGRVSHHSKALGAFLEISSPEAAAYLSARTNKKHFAWFFPVALITPIVLIAGSYIVKTYLQYEKERKARDAEIQVALEASGIDLNDEEACELFRMKEEMRMDIKEEMEKEYAKAKARITKELRKSYGQKN